MKAVIARCYLHLWWYSSFNVQCTPIIHIIHKPYCEIMCEILSRPSSLPSSLLQLFSSLIVQNHSAIQYYQINLEPFRALEVLQEGGPFRFRFLQKSLCLFCFSQESFQTMQGWHCQNFVSTKESNIPTFHKRPPRVFPLPCQWPQVMTFGKKWKCQQY